MTNLNTDVLILLNLDQLGMQFVTTTLDGSNYLSWSRTMVIVLRAKDKLAIVDGRCKKSKLDAAEYEQWHKTDSMVVS